VHDECWRGAEKRCNFVEYWCATQKLCTLDNDARNTKLDRAKY
jgi:hypothetical protein